MQISRLNLQDKTCGKIIFKHSCILMLYRGRHYTEYRRPSIPLMLWKPHAPIFPKLIKPIIEGLTKEETTAMRKRGLAGPALTKLGILFLFSFCYTYLVYSCMTLMGHLKLQPRTVIMVIWYLWLETLFSSAICFGLIARVLRRVITGKSGPN